MSEHNIAIIAADILGQSAFDCASYELNGLDGVTDCES